MITEDRSGLSPAAEELLDWLALLTGTDSWRMWWVVVLNHAENDLSVLSADERDRFGRAMRIVRSRT